MVGCEVVVFKEIVDGIFDKSIPPDIFTIFFEVVGFFDWNELQHFLVPLKFRFIANRARGLEVEKFFIVPDRHPTAEDRVQSALDVNSIDDLVAGGQGHEQTQK